MQRNKQEHQEIQDELQKKNQFLHMYSQEFVDSLDALRAQFGEGINDYTKDVLEKTDIQIRKNDCFIGYVKNLSDLCLDQNQKQTSMMGSFAQKIQCHYVQRQVNLHLSNSQITPTKLLSREASPTKAPSTQKKSSQKTNGHPVGRFNSSGRSHKSPK